MNRYTIILTLLITLSIYAKGQNKSLTFAFHSSYNESAWNHYQGAKRIYGNYTPRSINLDLVLTFDKKLSKWFSGLVEFENDLLYSRYNSDSKYYSNQASLGIGVRLRIFKNEKFFYNLKSLYGIGLHKENFYSKIQSKFLNHKQGAFHIISLSPEFLFKINSTTQIGIQFKAFYHIGSVEVNLQGIETEDYYRFSQKMFFLLGYEF